MEPKLKPNIHMSNQNYILAKKKNNCSTPIYKRGIFEQTLHILMNLILIMYLQGF